MKVIITDHAMERMEKYGIREAEVISALEKPDKTDKGRFGRKIAQKALNGYMIRVICEESDGTKNVITVYKARGSRYEV
jgi:hypothetical protein